MDFLEHSLTSSYKKKEMNNKSLEIKYKKWKEIHMDSNNKENDKN